MCINRRRIASFSDWSMGKDPTETPKDQNANEEKATEDLKQVVREDIEEQRALIEKLRRKMQLRPAQPHNRTTRF